MLKKLLLIAGTLGVVVVLFFAYHLGTGGHGRLAEELAIPPAPEDFKKLEDASRKPVVQAAAEIEDIELHAGRKGLITLFDPQTHERRVQFRAETWTSLNDNEVYMTGPEFRLLMPRGQIAEVRADEGQIEVQKRGNNYDPRRGWLRGHVQIFIDRTTPRWRRENPDRAELEQHPEQVVRLWLDEVTFDLDLARLETPGAFHIQSVETDIEGTGLLLRWNEAAQRIEQLEITEGRRMELRGRRLVSFNLPGSGQAVEPAGAIAGEEAALAMAAVRLIDPPPEPDAAPAVASASSANRPATIAEQAPFERGEQPSSPGDTGSPELIDGEEVLTISGMARRRLVEPQPTVYQTHFEGGVEVRQKEGAQVSGRLLADALELTFDFGRRQREMLSENSADDPRAEASGSSIELLWTGPMSMAPLHDEAEPRAVDRFHVLAVGSPLRLVDVQGIATCDRLIYENETRRARLIGSRERPVVVQAKGGDRHIAGEVMLLDRRRGTARVEGPGQMVRRGRSSGDSSGVLPVDAKESVTIRWQRSVELTFGVAAGNGEKSARREYLKHAVFEGDAVIAQGTDTGIKGDVVEATFAPPRAEQRTAEAIGQFDIGDNIERLQCRGNVHLYQPDEDIRCDRLIIEMAADERGRSYPRLANAWGDVAVRQGRGRIEASDHMLVRMATRLAFSPPRGAGSVRTAASDKRSRLRIEELAASGSVRAFDPDEKLDVSCAELSCRFGDDQTIETAVVIGSELQPASVRKDDYHVRGARVEIDGRAPSVVVPAAGSLEFKSDRRLDGRPAAEPVPVAVAFGRQMRLLGDENLLVFDGAVRAVSREPGKVHLLTRRVESLEEEYSLSCEHLEIGLADEVEPADEPAEPPLPLLGPLRAVLGRKQHRRTDDALRETKKPVWLIAEGDAVAARSSTNARTDVLATRMQISGPRMVSDLLRQRLNVQGAGVLLIEDYRLPVRKTAAAPRRVEPLLGEIGTEGPSQSLFSWQNALTYLRERRLAILDREVGVIHRSGSHLAYVEELARLRNVSPQELRKLGGRRVTLSCENLLVEFLNDFGAVDSAQAAAAVKRIQATGTAQLQDGTRSIVGQRVSYWQESELVQVEGGLGEPARFFDADPRTSQIRQQIRGDLLRWNRLTNRVEAVRPSVLATRP